MNPDLDALWANVVKARAAAKADGADLSSAEIDDYLQSESKGKYSLKDITDVSPRNIGRSFAQGLTQGGADELMSGAAAPETLAGIAAGGNRVFPGLGTAASAARDVAGKLSALFGGSPQTAESMRLKDQLFKEQHPGVAYPTEGSGMVAGMLALPEEALVGRGASLLSRAAHGAAVNAGIGAVAGALHGDDADSRLRGAAVSGALGGFLGAAVPAGVDAVEYFTNPAKRGYARLQKAIADSGGIDALLAKLKEFVQGGRGDVVRTSDLSNEMQGALDYAANNNLGVRQRVAAADFARRGDRPARFLNDLREITHPEASGGEGTPYAGYTPPHPALAGTDATDARGFQPFDPNAPLPFSGQAAEPFTPGSGRVEELRKARKIWADGPTGYGGLPEVAPNSPITSTTRTPEQLAAQAQHDAMLAFSSQKPGGPSPVVQRQLDAWKAAAGPQAELNPAEMIFHDFIQKPAAQTALKEANRAGLNDVPGVGEDVATVKKLIAVKRRLRGLSKEAYVRGRTDVGESLSALSEAFGEHLSENVPGYSAVNEEYAAKSGDIGKLKDGADAWTDPESRGIKSVMASMTPSKINNYRYGMASELVQKLRGPGADAFANALTRAGGRGIPDTPAVKSFTGWTNAEGMKNLSPEATALQDKLKVIFGSEFNFRVFMKRAALEADMMRGESAAGNSMTHVRGAEAAFDPADALMGVAAANHMTASPTMVMSAGQRLVARQARLAATRAAAASMEGPLTTVGAPAIDAMLNSMRTPPAPTGGKVPPIAAALASRGISGLFGP